MRVWRCPSHAAALTRVDSGSYEVGVLFVPSLLSSEGAAPVELVTTMMPGCAVAGMVDGDKLALPLPYALPPVRYAGTDTPWISSDE